MERKTAAVRIAVWSVILLALVGLLTYFMTASGSFFNLFGKNTVQSNTLVSSDTVSLDGVDRLSFKFAAGEVEFKDSGSDKMIVEYFSNMSSPMKININTSGSSVDVSQTSTSWFNWIGGVNNYTVVYLPNGYSHDMDIRVDAGRVTMYGYSFAKLKVTVNAGDVTFTEISANMLDFDVSAGNLSVNGSFSGIEGSVSAGDAKITSLSLPQTMDVNVSAGECIVYIPDTDDGFVLSYNHSAGDIKTDFDFSDSSLDGSGSYTYKNGTADYYVKVSAGTFKLKKV